MTEHVWSFRPASGHLTWADLTGYTVEATDGHIGKVDKHSYDVGDAYLVVDTGVWIFGKEVLLPASAVSRIDLEEEKVYVNADKDRIKNAPEFHREKHLRDPGYREEVGSYYGITWLPGEGPVGSHRG
ncbi:PRC-barrel domain-containing protein [Streptomyces sp. NBC_01207]|uniref:PRC-barrel domain-containing protein n=1 Tax=Streptomyces sp. NBC_01207 TaxID=2903772 RepID=UPI002E158821|nr:PRC-barrel domain-containing protein [Streptomyces sp. NBC_01207]